MMKRDASSTRRSVPHKHNALSLPDSTACNSQHNVATLLALELLQE
jgi:hypothetical protein